LDRSAFASGFLWTLLSTVVSRALLPVFGILIARVLGPETFGLYSVLLTLIAVFDVFRDAGLALTYVADEKLDDARRGAYATVAILTGGAMAGAMALAEPWLRVWFKFQAEPWAIPVAAAVLLANAFTSVPTAALLKAGRFRETSLSEIVPSAISYVVAFALVWAGWGFEALLVQLALRTVLFVAMTNRYAPMPKPGWDWHLVGDVFRKSNALLFSNILWTLYNLADQILIGRFLTQAAAGFNGVARNLALRPVEFVTIPLNRTMYVAVSGEPGDRSRAAKYLWSSVSVAVLFALPLYVGMALFAQPIILFLYGGAFAGAIPALQIVCGFYATRAVGMLAASALTAIGRASLTVYGWVAAYGVAGVGLYANWSSLDLLTVVSWLAWGGLAIYGPMVAAALFLIPPGSSERGKLIGAVCATLASGAVMGACSLLPIPLGAALGVAAVAGPAIHLAVAGLLRQRHPLAYFSKDGVRRLWRDL